MREEKESGNRAIRSDGKQFLKKIAQSDTLLRSAWRIDVLFLVAYSISFRRNKPQHSDKLMLPGCRWWNLRGGGRVAEPGERGETER